MTGRLTAGNGFRPMINKCQQESQPVIYVNLHFILCFIISSTLGFHLAENASIPCDLQALN